MVYNKILRHIREGTLIPAIGRKLVRIGKRDIFYRFDPDRRLAKRYEESLTSDSFGLIEAGNYFLDSRQPLNSESVVYSGGLGLDAEFDIFLADSYGCEVHLFDPTPLSKPFGEELQRRYDQMVFHPTGMWDESTTLEFVTPPSGGSASAVLSHQSDQTFRAEVKPIPQIMAELGHDKIDVLKLDIEGAAIRVLISTLESGIYPNQVVAEFERPRTDFGSILDYFCEVNSLMAQMREVGYECRLLPRAQYSYFSVELLFSRLS